MKIQDLVEKTNPNITFKYIDSSEGDKNRGWQIDEVKAYLDGKEVGYLKLSYIPRERFEKYYPGILNFLTQVNGSGDLPHGYETTPWKEIPIDKLRPYVYHMAQDAGIGWTESNALQSEAKTASDEQVHHIIDSLEKMLMKEKGILFKRFEKYFVDKPLVDYIRVNNEYRRQGIGTALYRAGYEWMKSKGLPLYASGVQSDEAKATWKSMQKDFPVTRERVGNPVVRHKRINRRKFV